MNVARVGRALRRRSRLLTGPLSGTTGHLPAGRDRLVVVLVDAAGVAPARHLSMLVWLWALRHDRCHVVGPQHATARWRDVVRHRVDDPLAASPILAALGPVDIVVDLLGSRAVDHRRVWEALFLHVRDGGTWVLGRSGLGHGAARRELRRWLRTAPERVEKPSLGPSDERERSTELAASIGHIAATPHALLVRQRRAHLWKLDETDVPDLLPLREPGLTWSDLQTLPADTLRPTARVHHHGPAAPTSWLAEHLDVPAMRLRRYAGDIGFGGRMLVHGQHTILPDSYSWPYAPDRNNPFTVNAGREFAHIPDEHLGTERLPGTYYLLDPNYGEYGHVLTEVVGRLWGWDEAKARIPDLKALFWVDHGRSDDPGHPKFALSEAYGIPAGDIVATSRPVRVDTLIAASPMWHNRTPHYAHPDLREVWLRLGRGLGSADVPPGERVFVGRSGAFARRSCRNDQQVQQFFVERGFTVIYPEHLSLAEQARVFAGARVVAGYAGSALFNVLFSRHLQALLVLTHSSYTARNEHLFGAVLDVPVHYFWSPADIAHPPDRKTFAAVESPWECDLGAIAGPLNEVLAGL